MKTILVVGPTEWDREELASPRFAERYRFRFVDDGACTVARVGVRHLFRRFDVLRYIDRIAALEGPIDGVIGTDEYLACAVAAAVAERRGLPGPRPEAVLLCQHKYHCREAQQEIVPEATAPFTLIDPFTLNGVPPPLPFPMFVKPVRGTFSVMARRVETYEALRDFVRLSFLERTVALNLLWPFNRLLERYTSLPLTANYFIGERVLDGALVTLEGYARRGRTEVIGIVDSIMYPGTTSFQRFDYPSRLDPQVQARMASIAARLVPRLGLDGTIFNIEMFHRPETDAIHILEVNPRMAYQFADLYEKVDGANSYEIQLALATGEEPRLERGRGRHRVASSFVFRRFQDARLVRQPDGAQLERVRALFPDARIRLYGRPGRKLSSVERGVESYRYAIVNLGGADRDDLFRRFEEAKSNLVFVFV